MDIMRHISGRRFTFKGSKVRGRETQRFSGKIHSKGVEILTETGKGNLCFTEFAAE